MSMSEEFKNRFRELVDTLDIADLRERAKIIGISKITFDNAYVFGIKPSQSTARRIAKYFNVSVNYLLCNTDNKQKTLA